MWLINHCLINLCSTIKQDCEAAIKLSLSDDGQSLSVIDVNENHSHEISQVINNYFLMKSVKHLQAIYEHLPRQRMLNEEVRKEAEGLLRMKVNKKLLQQRLNKKFGYKRGVPRAN